MGLTMTDRECFLAAVRRNPWDDTPRLVYADWCDEHGEPERAEFIRVQCEIAGLNPAVLEIVESTPERDWEADEYSRAAELRRRERELFIASKAGGGEWVFPPPPGIDYRFLPRDRDESVDRPHISTCLYRRGFVESVACPLLAWVGGPCGRCGGRGRIGQHWDPASDTMRGGTRCPECCRPGREQGATPGIAAAVVAACPGLVEVRATDREPLAMIDAGPNRRWLHGDGSRQDTPAMIAEPVFRRLGDPAFKGRRLGEWGWDYVTEAAARGDLSAALLDFGRG